MAWEKSTVVLVRCRETTRTKLSLRKGVMRLQHRVRVRVGYNSDQTLTRLKYLRPLILASLVFIKLDALLLR